MVVSFRNVPHTSHKWATEKPVGELVVSPLHPDYIAVKFFVSIQIADIFPLFPTKCGERHVGGAHNNAPSAICCGEEIYFFVREYAAGNKEPQGAILNTRNQVQLRFSSRLPYSLNGFKLISHDLLKRKRHDLVTAKDDFRLIEHRQQAVSEANARRVCNGVQRVDSGE